jgi:hypothetical protein
VALISQKVTEARIDELNRMPFKAENYDYHRKRWYELEATLTTKQEIKK